MRLFISADLNPSAMQNIAGIQSELKRHVRGSFPPVENLHLTLVFLGEIHASRIPIVCDILSQAVLPPVQLLFNGTGYFPRRGGDILWLGIERSAALDKLQCECVDRLVGEGFSIERRKFMPHITLARGVIRNGISPDYLGSKMLDKPFPAVIHSISLFSSELIYNKRVYLKICSREAVN